MSLLDSSFMPIAEADVQARLIALVDPNTGRDFATAKTVRKVSVDGSSVTVDLLLSYPAKSQHEALRTLVQSGLAALPGVGKITVNITHKIASHSVQRGVKLIPGVKNIIAVASNPHVTMMRASHRRAPNRNSSKFDGTSHSA